MPVVAQKIEIKASNKFKTYCRKAFGVSRFAYNWCVERFTKDYQQYLTEWSVYNRKLKEYSSSPLLHTQMPVKPKLPSALKEKRALSIYQRSHQVCKSTAFYKF